MPRLLKAYIAGVVALSAVALVAATLVIPVNPSIALPLGGSPAAQPTQVELMAGIAFWILLNLVVAALPVTLTHGTQQSVGNAPILAAVFLGGPAAAGWVTLIGTTESRELRGEIPWYGTLANHAGIVLPAIVAGLVLELLPAENQGFLADFIRAMLAAAVFYVLNVTLAGTLLALRTGKSLRTVLVGDSGSTAFQNLALGPLGWLMSIVYSIEWWATLVFALPLYTTRMASQRLVEMRDMFTQTIGALAELMVVELTYLEALVPPWTDSRSALRAPATFFAGTRRPRSISSS